MELNRYKINNDIKKSIILYNSAIGEIKKSNFELAVNDLKKALSYNKGFSDAIKLIGLCYVSMKQYRNAEKVFKKLKKYAIYDSLANDYIQSLKIKSSIGRNVNNMDVINHTNSDIWNEYSTEPKAFHREKNYGYIKHSNHYGRYCNELFLSKVYSDSNGKGSYRNSRIFE